MSSPTITAPTDELRREADRIEAIGGRSRFRRRRSIERSPESERLVLNAVARAKTRDEDALRFLYLRYADNVYGYVCTIVRDEHEAEDVTQQIFAKLITALPRYESRLGPFSAWILRVAHNAAVDHVRARRAIPCEEVRSPDLLDESVARERCADLRSALETLTREQRDVIVLRFVLGLSPVEIAERLGRTEDAVRGLQHRGRQTLRQELVRLESGPVSMAMS